MKKHLRIFLFLIGALMLLTLWGCSRYAQPLNDRHTIAVTDTGDSYAISLYPSKMELVYNDTTYTYSVSRGDDAITYTVYYPNGGSYYETRGNYVDTNGWNDAYQPHSYIAGEKLVDILSSHYYTYTLAPNIGNVICAVLCIGLGCFNLFLPEAAWSLGHIFKSWQYESIEPSEAGLICTRIGGILCIILGIIYFFSNWS